MKIAPGLIPKIKMVAPGTLLRRALDDIIMAEFGALIVFLDDIREQEDILQGGFYIGASFSPEKLYELAKMDGAIILDESVSRILAANVQLAPDPSLPTHETGMRHRAAERMARQTSKFVLTISRRRKVITLYYENHKHPISEINTLLARISQTIYTAERYKGNLDNKSLTIERDEFLDRVQLIQLTELINDCIGIMSLLSEIEPYVFEIGSEGRLPLMRLNSIKDDVATSMQLFVKDYCFQNPSDSKVISLIEDLKNVSPADHLKIAEILGWPVTGEANLYDVTVRPRGYRLLKQVAKIPPGTAEKVVDQFGDLVHLSTADEETLQEVDGIGEKRAQSIIDGIQHMRSRSIYR
jgi:diadenylate cyclase